MKLNTWRRRITIKNENAVSKCFVLGKKKSRSGRLPKTIFLNSANYSGMKVNLFYHFYLDLPEVIFHKFS